MANEAWKDSPNYQSGSVRGREIAIEQYKAKNIPKLERMFKAPSPRGTDDLGIKPKPNNIPWHNKRPEYAPSYDWYKRKRDSLPNDQFRERGKPYNQGGSGSNKGGGVGGRGNPGIPRGNGGGGVAPSTPSVLQAPKGITVKIPMPTNIGQLGKGLGGIGTILGGIEAIGQLGRDLNNQWKHMQNLVDELQGKNPRFRAQDFDYPPTWFDWLLPENKPVPKTQPTPTVPGDPIAGLPRTRWGRSGVDYTLWRSGSVVWTDPQGTRDVRTDVSGQLGGLVAGPLEIFSVTVPYGGTSASTLFIKGAGQSDSEAHTISSYWRDNDGFIQAMEATVQAIPYENDYPIVEPSPYPIYQPGFIPYESPEPPPKQQPDKNKVGTAPYTGDKLGRSPDPIPYIPGYGTGVPGQPETVPVPKPTPKPEPGPSPGPPIPARAPQPSPGAYPSPGNSPGASGASSTRLTDEPGTGEKAKSGGGSASIPTPTPTPVKKEEPKPNEGFNPLNPFPIPVFPIPGRVTNPQPQPGTGDPVGGDTGTPRPTVCRYDSSNISGKVDRAQLSLEAISLFQQNQMMNKLNGIDAKLGDQLPGGISGRIVKIGKFMGVDRVMQVISFLAVLHNAFMLSSMLPLTLFSAIDTTALLFDSDPNDEPLDSGKVIGGAIRGFFEATFGVEAVGSVTHIWNKFNRILSATANLLFSLQSIAWSLFEILETLAQWVAQIGNALQKWGVIGEEVNKWLNPGINFTFAKYLTRLNQAQEVLEAIEQIASELVNVQESAALAATQTAELQKAIVGDPDKQTAVIDKPTAPDHAASKKEQTDQKQYSQSPTIQDTDLIRPDVGVSA